MAALDFQGLRFHPGKGDALLWAADGWGGLDGGAENDRLRIGDAAENAAEWLVRVLTMPSSMT